MGFDLGDYKDVAQRRREFRDKFPDGSLQCVEWRLVEVGGQSYVCYEAAAYRTPEDPIPGHGTAWEPVPGSTPYTRGSELQNAETSAWGRAIVATLAVDEKNLASADEIRSRQDAPEPPAGPTRRGGPPVCVVCGEPITGPAHRSGAGVAHKACVEPAANPSEEPF